MAFEDGEITLGPCCACRGTEDVHTIVILPHKNAIPSRGWGCFVCNLPCEGASAVLCDSCAAGYQLGTVKLVEACRGWAGEDGREPIATTRARGVHDHDLTYHPEATRP